MPHSLAVTMLPSSAVSVPAMQASRVLFPLPFLPMRAAFSPLLRPKVTPEKRGASRPILPKSLIESTFMA